MTGKQLKNSILQWAIEGRLVPQDAADEPASVLLERIHKEKARLVKEGKLKRDKNETTIYRAADNSHYEKLADGTVRCIDDEIPFEVPEGWAWTRIGQIFIHASGKQQSSNNKKTGTPQKFITTSNLYWGHFSLDRLKEMYFTQDEIRVCSATKGDLLVCEGGAGYGRSAIWNYDFDICLQNHVHRLRPYLTGIAEYVYHVIYYLKESNQLASVGTAMPGLSANRLKSILIPLPPLSEQQRIVAKLEEVLPVVDKYDKAQAELDTLNDNIKALLKKSILQEAIQGRLVPQLHDDEPATELLNRIRKEKQALVKQGKLKPKDITDSTIYRAADNRHYEKQGKVNIDISDEIPFDIPNSWQWIRFGEYVKMKIGKTPARGYPDYWINGKYPWVSISDMKDLGVIMSTKEKVSELASAKELGSISPSGTLLMSFKLTVGRTSLLGIDAFHNEAIISVYPYVDDNHITRDYLFYTLPFMSTMGDSKDAIKGKTLNSASLYKMLIPIPPLYEQKRIVRRIKELYCKL